MVKTVVILGAGWAGLPLAHKLLKYTLPKTSLKVVLVTPNTHFFWNVAATRGAIPGEIPDTSMFLPIAPGFNQYTTENFELVLGLAEGIDKAGSSVHITTNDGEQKIISYDQLVIATGSRVSSGLPFKLIGTYKETVDAWHSLQDQIRGASSIVIAGGGPTGLEVAGEIAARYGAKKNVTLILSSAKPLANHAGISASVQNVLDSDFTNLGVKVLRNTKVESAEGGSSDGKWSLTLSDGSTLDADLYLPLHGIQVNTSFVPRELLDDRGNVKQDKTMRVEATENIWAIGDVGNTEPKQLTLTDAQINHMADALDATLTGERPVGEYKPANKTMIFLSLGKKYATGQIGNWRLWGWTVAWVKGRNLFVDSSQDYVAGKRLRHGSL